MVNPNVTESKTEPEYSLSGVHRIAGFQQVVYSGRKIQRHITDLGYQLDDVCALLCILQESHFHKSERYGNDSRWHDVYLLPQPVPEDPRQRLYIKFRVRSDCVYIDLCSFHPEGWQ